jgi:hypothetical protein
LRYFSAVLPAAGVLALVDWTSAIVYLGALSASAPVERDVRERTVAGLSGDEGKQSLVPMTARGLTRSTLA